MLKLFTNLRAKRRYKKFSQKWNSDYFVITHYIQQSKDCNAPFKWNQLVTQEIWMWIKLDKQITPEDWNWIVNRRGFDYNMRAYLFTMVKHIGLGKLLSYP